MATATDQAVEGEISILVRIFGGEDGILPEKMARYILDLKISERDHSRMHALAQQNRASGLSVAEKEELIAFDKAATLLSILKSKARMRLGVKLEHSLDF